VSEQPILGYTCWKCEACGSQMAMPVTSQEQYMAISQTNVVPFPPKDYDKCKCGRPFLFTGVTWSKP